MKDVHQEKPVEKPPEPVFVEPPKEPAAGKFVAVPVSDDEEGEAEKAEPPPPKPEPKKEAPKEEVKGTY